MVCSRPAVKNHTRSLKTGPPIVYSCIGIALFFPFGIAQGGDATGLLLALPALVVKLAVGGFLLALIETVSAKMRIFRAPEFLGTAFMLAVLALLLHVLLEVQ